MPAAPQHSSGVVDAREPAAERAQQGLDASAQLLAVLKCARRLPRDDGAGTRAYTGASQVLRRDDLAQVAGRKRDLSARATRTGSSRNR